MQRHDTSQWPHLIENLRRHEVTFDSSLTTSDAALVSRSRSVEKLLDLGYAEASVGAPTELLVDTLIQVFGPTVVVQDLARGPITCSIADVYGARTRAPVTRADGSFLYDIASTSDDDLARVTHVVRGQDKFEASVRQELLALALGTPPRQYLHLPLFVGGSTIDGRTKLLGPELEALGASPLAVTTYLARSLTSPVSEGPLALEDILAAFVPQDCARRSARVDTAVLRRIQRQLEGSEALRKRMVLSLYGDRRWAELPTIARLLLQHVRTNGEQRTEIERLSPLLAEPKVWIEGASRKLKLRDSGPSGIQEALRTRRVAHDEVQQAFFGKALGLNTSDFVEVIARWERNMSAA